MPAKEHVSCLKEDLRPFFVADGWDSFLNILHCKEKKLYICPECKILDSHTLKIICCDKQGCEQWFHFQVHLGGRVGIIRMLWSVFVTIVNFYDDFFF